MNIISQGVSFEVVDKHPFDSVQGNIFVMASPGAIRNLPQHFGQFLHINNKVLKLDLTQANVLKNNNFIQSCCFNYADHGGMVHLSINGQVSTVENDLIAYHNKVVNDGTNNVKIEVTKVIDGYNHNGVVILTATVGTIHTLELGGQELFVDHLCIPCEDRPTTTTDASGCIEFEDLVDFRKYTNNQVLTSQNVDFNIVNRNGLSSNNVRVIPSPGAGITNKPQHYGKYLHINNIVLRLEVGQAGITNPVTSACFNYAETGGYVHLAVNDDYSQGKRDDLFDYNGLTIGNVMVRVTKTLFNSASGSKDHYGVV